MSQFIGMHLVIFNFWINRHPCSSVLETDRKPFQLQASPLQVNLTSDLPVEGCNKKQFPCWINGIINNIVYPPTATVISCHYQLYISVFALFVFQ